MDANNLYLNAVKDKAKEMAALGVLMTLLSFSATAQNASSQNMEASSIAVVGEVYEYSGKCSAVACFPTIYKIIVSRVFENKENKSNRDIADLTTCGPSGLKTGVKYAFFLRKHLIKGSAKKNPLFYSEEADSLCLYDFGAGDVLMIDEHMNLYSASILFDKNVHRDDFIVAGTLNKQMTKKYKKQLSDAQHP